ncbi:hypothetical protein ACFVJK_21590 [Streptomyces sp. NPDC127172]|uniref:helix-turn-helix domain-containing protein n=1 Tax=Streptomyces sp. NPDC127172 TaxID=3345382 RepID=UPI003635B3E5
MLPEVAALATELTTLFKGLDITQQQYAIRTNLDKSYISRFLNGRRVASIEFVERLIKETEKHRHAKLTEETRLRLFALRSAALRAFDPGLYRLESLRTEVDRSQRDIRRLLLHQEALENLLEQRQAEVTDMRNELNQVNSDWVADRIAHEAAELLSKGEKGRISDERDELKREIENLRRELNITVAQKDRAEARCGELEAEVSAIEGSLAEKLERDGVDEVGEPIELTFTRILELVNYNRSAANREVTECTLSRTSRDNAKLFLWLDQESQGDLSKQLLSDYSRLNSTERIAQFILEVEKAGFDSSKRPSPEFSLMGGLRWLEFPALTELITALDSGRQEFPRKPQFVKIYTVANSWVTSDRPSTSTGTAGSRVPFFIPLYDQLSACHEGRAEYNFTYRVAARSDRAPDYLKCMSDAGRWDVAEPFLNIWARTSNVPKLVRGGESICLFEDRRMVDLLMESIRMHNDANDIGRILVDSLTDRHGPHEKFRTTLLREALKWHEGSILTAAVSRYQVAFTNSDPASHHKHEDARATLRAEIARLEQR